MIYSAAVSHKRWEKQQSMLLEEKNQRGGNQRYSTAKPALQQELLVFPLSWSQWDTNAASPFIDKQENPSRTLSHGARFRSTDTSMNFFI